MSHPDKYKFHSTCPVDKSSKSLMSHPGARGAMLRSFYVHVMLKFAPMLNCACQVNSVQQVHRYNIKVGPCESLSESANSPQNMIFHNFAVK